VAQAPRSRCLDPQIIGRGTLRHGRGTCRVRVGRVLAICDAPKASAHLLHTGNTFVRLFGKLASHQRLWTHRGLWRRRCGRSRDRPVGRWLCGGSGAQNASRCYPERFRSAVGRLLERLFADAWRQSGRVTFETNLEHAGGPEFLGADKGDGFSCCLFRPASLAWSLCHSSFSEGSGVNVFRFRRSPGISSELRAARPGARHADMQRLRRAGRTVRLWASCPPSMRAMVTWETSASFVSYAGTEHRLGATPPYQSGQFDHARNDGARCMRSLDQS